MESTYQPKYHIGDWVYYLDRPWRINDISTSDSGPIYILKVTDSNLVPTLNCEQEDPYLKKV